MMPYKAADRKNIQQFELREIHAVESIGHSISLLFFLRSDTNKRPYMLTTTRLEWVEERKSSLSSLCKKKASMS